MYVSFIIYTDFTDLLVAVNGDILDAQSDADRHEMEVEEKDSELNTRGEHQYEAVSRKRRRLPSSNRNHDILTNETQHNNVEDDSNVNGMVDIADEMERPRKRRRLQPEQRNLNFEPSNNSNSMDIEDENTNTGNINLSNSDSEIDVSDITAKIVSWDCYNDIHISYIISIFFCPPCWKFTS